MPQYVYPDDFEGTFWTVVDGVWYVSTVGNDVTGDGSPKNPFLTVAKAFEIAADGEKIVIGPDEYIAYDSVAYDQSGAEYPCRLATTTNVPVETGGLMTVDGVITQEGDRVLVWNQNGPAQNGIYIASSGPWQRDNNFSNSENIVPGKLIPILEGNQYAKNIFQLTTIETISVGTTYLTFDKASASDWGDLQGDINEQTDLVAALDAKADKTEVQDTYGFQLRFNRHLTHVQIVSIDHSKTLTEKLEGVTGVFYRTSEDFGATWISHTDIEAVNTHISGLSVDPWLEVGVNSVTNQVGFVVINAI